MANIKQLKLDYEKAKSAKVNENCKCPSCGKSFLKTNYQQAFCKTKPGTECKDYYWNNVTPKKRNNTTRISPANARYKNNVILPAIAREHGFPDVQTMRNHIEEDEGAPIYVSNCDFCGLKYEYCRCDD